MDYWEGPARWINTILLVIVAFIGFDTLFRLLNANEENMIVGLVAAVAGLFLAPFEGMFPDQEFLLTAIIAVLGYSLLAGIALAVTRSVQATRRASARRRAEPPQPGAGSPRPVAPETHGPHDSETTQPLGPVPVDTGEDATRPLPGQRTGGGDGRKRRPAPGAQPGAGEGSAQPTAPRAGPEQQDRTEPTRPARRREPGGQKDRTQRLS